MKSCFQKLCHVKLRTSSVSDLMETQHAQAHLQTLKVLRLLWDSFHHEENDGGSFCKLLLPGSREVGRKTSHPGGNGDTAPPLTFTVCSRMAGLVSRKPCTTWGKIWLLTMGSFRYSMKFSIWSRKWHNQQQALAQYWTLVLRMLLTSRTFIIPSSHTVCTEFSLLARKDTPDSGLSISP